MLQKICKSKKTQVILALLLIATMVLTDVLFLGKNLISYAAEINLESQGDSTQSDNVKFDAYFNDIDGNMVHSAILDAKGEDAAINLHLKINDTGYLKEGYVYFRDENNTTSTNYEISENSEGTSLVQSVNAELKTMSLNYIDYGTDAVIKVPVKIELSELTQIAKLNQNTLITLRGIYVAGNGKEINISKTVTLNLRWSLRSSLNVEQSISKYVAYETEESNEVILQSEIKVFQKRDDVTLPVHSTQIKVKAIELANKLPKKVVVTADDTMATNGNKIEFTSENWEYNEEEKTIIINTAGFEENGKVWSGVGKDIYYVTYVYEDVDLSAVPEKIQLEADVKMNVYGAGTIVNAGINHIETADLNGKIGDIVTYTVEAKNKELSKGKIYANYNSAEKIYDTEYETIVKANVSNYETVENLKFEMPADTFIGDKETKINQNYYKELAIDATKMKNILGEDGSLTIKYNENTMIINKDFQEIDGKYIVEIEENATDLSIETSKPVEDGILEIDVKKVISKDLSCSKNEVINAKELKLNLNGAIKSESIVLTESATNAKLEINNNNLSALAENNNVEFKITLNNNVETSDLYKNAVFTINLPKYIEDIEITGQNIFYTNGLEIANIEKEYTKNGIVLKITTTGTETMFSDGMYTNGTNIVLNANIKVNKEAPNITEKITMTYTNENAVTYLNIVENGFYGKEEIDINIIAPEEMKIFSSVFASNVEAISVLGKEQAVKLETEAESKTATMKISMLNKYSNICNNIKILGRTPFEGNTKITTGEDLGTTFTADLISTINTNGVNALVYYSENANATENLEDEENGWTADINSVGSVKSYLIILQDYEMNSGDSLEFSYDCAIPENLEHNESAFGTYVVYFDNVSEFTESKIAEAPKTGVTTGTVAKLEMETKAKYQGKESEENGVIAENQEATYTTTISNTGSIDAENVVVVSTISNGTIIEAEGGIIEGNKITWNLGTISAETTKTLEYTATAIKPQGDNTKLENTVVLTASNFDSSLTNNLGGDIKNAEVEAHLNCEWVNSNNLNYTDLIFDIALDNISDKTINNITLTQKIPENITFNKDKNDSDIHYDDQNKTVTINIAKLDPDERFDKNLILRTNIPNNMGEIYITNKYKVTSPDLISEYYSNSLTLKAIAPILSVELASNIKNGEYIKDGQIIEITGIAKNVGNIVARNAEVCINIPENFEVTEATATSMDGETWEMNIGSGNKYYINTELAINEEITFKIVGVARLKYDSDEEKIEFSSTIKSDRRDEIQSNKIEFIIEDPVDPTPTPVPTTVPTTIPTTTPTDDPTDDPSNPTATPTVEPDDPTDPDDPAKKTYKISGKAWLDKDSNGRMDETEDLIEGINVILIDSKTNTVVQEIKTSGNGEYVFSKLDPGSYIVIFEYDSNFYDITDYRKTGVEDYLASKVIEAQVKRNGKIVIAAITNPITVSDLSVANINIGLIEKPKFDLSLTKELNKVSIVNSAGVKEYTFENGKLGKIEIPAKYLKTTMATIEYKITITNTGVVAGTAKKIVDYISSDLNFDEGINEGWYRGNDGNLYNNTLADLTLNPGESKELTLILTKQMTEENTGTIYNRAEIYEDYNELGIEDYNSTPGNKAQDENDLDYANLIIMAKTGKTAIYITIIIISMGIIAVGAYMINKKVLKGGKIDE